MRRFPLTLGVLGGFILASALAAAPLAHAEGPAFDLTGPKVDVHVQRAGKTLPIANVPNLMGGDRLWIHPDLPPTQSAHYILIVAFLRGSTNPPPSDWFRKVETWQPAVRSEGVFVSVPAEAQQALVFLAPETGGDFNTLRKAVQGRPGSFVRATQDLQLASWDRMRLDAYLAEIKLLTGSDPKTLKERTDMMARSLGLKVDQGCFDKPVEQQASCLTQHTEGLVLDDSNAQSVVTQMANGSAADMMNQLSYSARFGAGAFSPYVGAVLDVARILSSLHTAKYQYIPALAVPQSEQPDTLNLKLNVPPSFRDPKSVIVVALPPVEPVKLPQMHAAADQAGADKDKDKNAPPPDLYCAAKPDVVFAAEGAPLVYATGLAHELMLHIDTKAKQPATGSEHTILSPKDSAAASTKSAAGIDLPVRPDPSRGGFVLSQPLPPLPEAATTAELRGQWGFDEWNGPKFHLISARPGGWTLASTDQNALIVGREDTLHLDGESSLCVQDVSAEVGHRSEKLPWKSPKPNQIEVTLPLKEAQPGAVTISVHQYGLTKPDEISLKSYAEAASLEHFNLSVGDKAAELKGKRLDEVESAVLNGVSFSPAALHRVQDYDELALSASGSTSSLQPGENYSARVLLRDGRTLQVPASVGRSRPQVDLLSKSVQHDDASPDSGVKLGSSSNSDDLPLQRKLVFFLKSRVPSAFPRAEKVEIAAADGSFSTTLSLADRSPDGGMLLEDAHTAVVTIDPLARFGSSAFGPIQLRAISPAGVTGDWVPLGTLVRLPGFSASSALKCPRNQSRPCQLSGSNLFLITAVGSTPQMDNAVDVPADMTSGAIQVPNIGRPATPPPGTPGGPQGTLYVRLRDDPDTVQQLSLPMTSVGSAEPVKTPAPQHSNESPDLTTTAIPGAAATAAAQPSAPAATPASAPASGSASATPPAQTPHE
ncbi:MAG TPA: hypothetical protein VL346_00380 [Acidobacteriaceae bacterium]|nr:hypothetical protein [Acidobacteriaceae bacterium]